MDKCKICGLDGKEKEKLHSMLKELNQFDEEFVKEMMKSDT